MKKASMKVMKKPGAAAAVDVPKASGDDKFQIRSRRNPAAHLAQTYILKNGRFLIGCSVARDPEHEKAIVEVKKQWGLGNIDTKDAAVALLDELAPKPEDVS